MGLSIKNLGKSIGKALGQVGKALKKAAPVLIPIAIAGVTGGLGSGGWLGQVSKTLFGGSNLGAIGKNLLGGLTKGGLIKAASPGGIGATVAEKLVDPNGGDKSGGGLMNFGGLVQKFLPTLITDMINGKPKSASKEAAELYNNAPLQTPAQADIANSMASMFKDNLANQKEITPRSFDTRGPIVIGDPMTASKSLINPSTKDRFSDSQGPDLGSTPARQPISFTKPMENKVAPVLSEQKDIRRASYNADPRISPTAGIPSGESFSMQQAVAAALAKPENSLEGLLAPVSPAGIQTGGAVGSFSAPVASNPMNRLNNRPRGFAVRGRM